MKIIVFILSMGWLLPSAYAQNRPDLTHHNVTTSMPLPQHMPDQVNQQQANRLQRMIENQREMAKHHPPK